MAPVSAGILRTLFGPRTAKGWSIDSLVSVDLGPKEPESDTLYPVPDGMIADQNMRLPWTKLSLLGQSIVPIVANMPGESTLRCIGTGFIVSCTGLMLTAAHVISDVIERRTGVVEVDELTWKAEQLNFGVLIPMNPFFQGRGYIFFGIEWSAFLAERRPNPLPFKGIDLKLTSDIAICKIKQWQNGAPHQPITIVQRGIQGLGATIGSPIFALGYAGMSDIELTMLDAGRAAFDAKFQLHVSKGEITEKFPDNLMSREVSTPGPCFAFGAKIPGGMSGSPIFDREGIYVHGIVSKGLEDENGLARHSYGSIIGPSMHLPIARLDNQTLLQVQAGIEHGMPKAQGPGI